MKAIVHHLAAHSEPVKHSQQAAWYRCTNVDWMLEYAKNRGVSYKKILKVKVECAMLIAQKLTDKRSVEALVAGERYLDNEISLAELDGYAAAAHAAAYESGSIAAMSAANAISEEYEAVEIVAQLMGDKGRAECARICREVISFFK